MSGIRIISDPHIGHENIAINRGFKDADEQTEYLIKQWNSVVVKRDTVWILGDITMEKSKYYHILDRLNGIKKVVLGNHDKPQHVLELLKHVNLVCGMFQLKHKGIKMILSHCPIHEIELRGFNYNVHGHVHEKTIQNDRYVNTCCDVLDFKPQTLDELLKL